MPDRPIFALSYDFDKTLSPRNMQEYAFIDDIGMTAEDFDELDAVDYRKLQETFRGFLGLTAA